MNSDGIEIIGCTPALPVAEEPFVSPEELDARLRALGARESGGDMAREPGLGLGDVPDEDLEEGGGDV